MRHAQVEIREAAEGPTLYGTLITEGRAASGGRAEVFAPGSVEWPTEGVGVLLAHRAAPKIRAIPERQPDGRITVQAPATPEIRVAVDGGQRYMSVEFHSLAERTTRGGVREVLRALVPSVALVADPEYDTTSAEVRQRGTMSGSMPTGAAVDCRCGPGGCDQAIVERIEVTADDLLGYLGDYSKPLGPATVTERGGRLVTAIEIAAGVSYADDLLALLAEGVSPIVRPYPDRARSTIRKDGRVLVYETLAVAGLIATFTDQRGGFEAATLANDPEDRRGKMPVSGSSALERSGRRRLWL